MRRGLRHPKPAGHRLNPHRRVESRIGAHPRRKEPQRPQRRRTKQHVGADGRDDLDARAVRHQRREYVHRVRAGFFECFRLGRSGLERLRPRREGRGVRRQQRGDAAQERRVLGEVVGAHERRQRHVRPDLPGEAVDRFVAEFFLECGPPCVGGDGGEVEGHPEKRFPARYRRAPSVNLTGSRTCQVCWAESAR